MIFLFPVHHITIERAFSSEPTLEKLAVPVSNYQNLGSACVKDFHRSPGTYCWNLRSFRAVCGSFHPFALGLNLQITRSEN